MASTSTTASELDESTNSLCVASALEERTEATEVATQKLLQELHTMMDALRLHTLESARATHQHSEVVMSAASSIKGAAKHLEEESMGMLKQAADLHALMSSLTELGQQAANVRREISSLEIEVVRLHGRAVTRMSRAASARSVRVIRAPVETELQLRGSNQSSYQPPNSSDKLCGPPETSGSMSKLQ